MTTATAVQKSTEFGQTEFLANAVNYRAHKRMVDACSSYDNIDDAMAGLKSVWDALQVQIENGGKFTPDRELGFGSDNAATIAETLTGLRSTTGATRKAFGSLGKV